MADHHEVGGPELTGHLISDLSAAAQEVRLRAQPEVEDHGMNEWYDELRAGDVDDEWIRAKEIESGVVAPIPHHPTPFHGRIPVVQEGRGYLEVRPAAYGAAGDLGRLHLEGAGEYISAAGRAHFISDDQFRAFADKFKNEDGKFVTMTPYGAVPLPDNMFKDVPEKFVAKPEHEEMDTFVLKKKYHDRLLEKGYTQFEHVFVEVPKPATLTKLTPAAGVQQIEIPKYVYKPVIEEKTVEVPLGINYTEVPIECAMPYPPKLVPVPAPVIVERIIHATKPIVQEKIIEKPKIIQRDVPHVVTKEIPYIVPKYVEKIIEVPFKPGMPLPEPQGIIADAIPEPPASPFQPPMPGAEGQLLPGSPQVGSPPFGSPGGRLGAPMPMAIGPDGRPIAMSPGHEGARIEGETLVLPENEAGKPQTFFLNPGVKEIRLPYEAQLDVSIMPCEDAQQMEAALEAAGKHPYKSGQRFVRGPDGKWMPVSPGAVGSPTVPGPTAGFDFMGMTRKGLGMPGKLTQKVGGICSGCAQCVTRCCCQPGVPRIEIKEEGAAGEAAPGPLGLGGGAHDNIPNAVYPVDMSPVVAHDPPMIHNIDFVLHNKCPKVLTQRGIRNLKCMAPLHPCTSGTKVLFPPHPNNVPIPMKDNEADMEELDRIQQDYISKMNLRFQEAEMNQFEMNKSVQQQSRAGDDGFEKQPPAEW